MPLKLYDRLSKIDFYVGLFKWWWVVPATTAVVGAYLAALSHLPAWQLYSVSLFALVCGVWLVAGSRLAYLRWSPWGKLTRGELADRRAVQIAKWREMVTEVDATLQSQREARRAGHKTRSEGTTRLLEGRVAFHSLRPHLSDQAKTTIWDSYSLPPETRSLSDMDEVLQAVLLEIDRLEEEWRLR